MARHELIIDSLRDAAAHCKCGKWVYRETDDDINSAISHSYWQHAPVFPFFPNSTLAHKIIAFCEFRHLPEDGELDEDTRRDLAAILKSAERQYRRERRKRQ
jgi:hypothetical protein